MQEHADLARLFGGAPIPLALLTQFTGTTAENAGCIHTPAAGPHQPFAAAPGA